METLKNIWHNEEFQKQLKTFLWQTAEGFVAFLIGIIAIFQPDVINPLAVLALAGATSILLQVSKFINKKTL